MVWDFNEHAWSLEKSARHFFTDCVCKHSMCPELWWLLDFSSAYSENIHSVLCNILLNGSMWLTDPFFVKQQKSIFLVHNTSTFVPQHPEWMCFCRNMFHINMQTFHTDASSYIKWISRVVASWDVSAPCNTSPAAVWGTAACGPCGKNQQERTDPICLGSNTLFKTTRV